jgi:hypothetical protein
MGNLSYFTLNVQFSTLLSYCTFFSSHTTFSTTLSAHDAQRPGGLAQRRLPQQVKRATKVKISTKNSAGVLPPLRQTASWLLCILFLIYSD